jgi:hypothetical protein
MVAGREALPNRSDTRPRLTQHVISWCPVLTSGHCRNRGRRGRLETRSHLSLTGSDLQEQQHGEREADDPPLR